MKAKTRPIMIIILILTQPIGFALEMFYHNYITALLAVVWFVFGLCLIGNIMFDGLK